MTENDQSTSKWSAMYSEDKVWSSFPCTLVSVKRGSYEITAVYLPLISVIGQFNIFLWSPWLFSSWFFMNLHIIVHYCIILQLTELNFCRKSIFAHIWAKSIRWGQIFKTMLPGAWVKLFRIFFSLTCKYISL